MAQYLFDGDHLDASGNGHHAAEFGTFFSLGHVDPLSDVLASDPTRGGVYSYTNAELFYDWGNAGSPRNNRINLEATLPLPNVPANTGITLMAWIKREAVHTMNNGGNVHDGSIFHLGDCGDNPIATMSIDTEGNLAGYIEGDLAGGGEQVLTSSDLFVQPNQWHHLAIVYDRVSNVATAYIDGVAQTTPTDISSVGDGEMDFTRAYIGSFCNGSKAFIGQIDDARIFYGLLSGAEIATIIAKTTPPVIDSFAVIDEFLATAGQMTTLSWQASGQCELSLEPGGVIADGVTSEAVSPLETTTYTLTAKNGSAIVSRSLTIVVEEAPVVSSFVVDRTSVSPGGLVHFDFEVAGATNVSIDNGVDSLTRTAAVVSTTTYELTASNAAGTSTAEVTVEVLPVAEATFLIDFGDTSTAAGRPNGAAADGNFWNILVNFRDGKIDPLVDNANGTTQGITMEVTDGFDRLITDAASDATAYTILAAGDACSSDVFTSNGLAELQLSGLDPTGGTVYDLKFFASLASTSLPPVADINLMIEYQVIGQEANTVTLNGADNIDETVSIDSVIPASDGTILIQMSGANANSAGSGLNTLELTTREAPLDFRIISLEIEEGTGAPTLTWNSMTGANYAIFRSTDLKVWQEVEDNTTAIARIHSWTDPEPLTGQAFYYVSE